MGNPWPEESGWPCGEAAQWWIKEKVSAAWENDKPETSRQDSQCYVRQVQRAQIFFQQMTTSHELSSKISKFYSKQKWATHDLRKVVDHVAKQLNDGSKRKFQPLEKTTSLKHPDKILNVTFARCSAHRSFFSRWRLPMSCQVKFQNFTQSRSGQPMTWRKWLTMWRSSSMMDQRESFSRLRKRQAWNIPTKFSTLHSPGAARTDLFSADDDFPWAVK